MSWTGTQQRAMSPEVVPRPVEDYEQEPSAACSLPNDSATKQSIFLFSIRTMGFWRLWRVLLVMVTHPKCQRRLGSE